MRRTSLVECWLLKPDDMVLYIWASCEEKKMKEVAQFTFLKLFY